MRDERRNWGKGGETIFLKEKMVSRVDVSNSTDEKRPVFMPIRSIHLICTTQPRAGGGEGNQLSMQQNTPLAQPIFFIVAFTEFELDACQAREALG